MPDLFDSFDPASLQGDMDAAVQKHGTSLLLHAVAASAAEKAVHSTFFMLGVDLKDQDDVESTRDSFRQMRKESDRRQKRKDSWHSALTHGIYTIIAGVVLAVTGAFASHSFGWKLPLE